MRTKCCKCGTELHGRNAQDMGICLECYNIENSDFEEEEEGMRIPTKIKTTMTEAERIRKEATKFATFETAPNEMEKYNELYSGYITGATAENERLQQQLKTQNELLETANNSFNDIYKELKSAQELNLELMEGIKKAFRKGTWLSMYEELESLINKAK